MGECFGFPSLWEHASDSAACEEQVQTFLLTQDGGGVVQMTVLVCPGVGDTREGYPLRLQPMSTLLPRQTSPLRGPPQLRRARALLLSAGAHFGEGRTTCLSLPIDNREH